jgi:thiamine biosynthesis lipoprotein
MGTTFRVVLYAVNDAAASKGRDAAFGTIADLDQRLTDYRDDSELMRACAEAWRHPVALSPDVFEVLARGQAIARRSDGAFDMTVGALSKLWRHARRQGEWPDAKELADARGLVGFRLMTLDASAHTLTLARQGVRLDLGGIAKGFAADRALQTLRGRGIQRAIVVAGGDIAIGDPPPDAKGWRIDIVPFDGVSPPVRAVTLANAGISTSGDAEQFMELGGVRYSHVLDPRTGEPLTGRSAVTIVARDATTSDAMAKAVAVLGPEAGIRLADATRGVEALMGFATPGRPVRWITSAHWRGH